MRAPRGFWDERRNSQIKRKLHTLTYLYKDCEIEVGEGVVKKSEEMVYRFGFEEDETVKNIARCSHCKQVKKYRVSQQKVSRS